MATILGRFIALLLLNLVVLAVHLPHKQHLGFKRQLEAQHVDIYPERNLPMYLDGPMQKGSTPWAGADPAGDPPNTGKIRQYSFTVSRASVNVDGTSKGVILVNNQFPGPLIEANWGDTFMITVTNDIAPEEEEGLSIHWHGIFQRRTPEMDGVPGVSQCPIPPRKSFTYTFQADQYGTGWWHSHYSSQYADGLFGPIVIYGPSNVNYTADLGPLMLEDYFHETYEEVNNIVFAVPAGFPTVNNNLINGKGCQLVGKGCASYNNLAKFNVTSGKAYRMRLINTSASSTQLFTIDDHVMQIFAIDFTPIIPYNTTTVTLGIGQRADILLYASGEPTDAVWIRSELDIRCGVETANNSQARAVLYYEDADQSRLPSTSGLPPIRQDCRGDPISMTVPLHPSPLPSPPVAQQTLEIALEVNASLVSLFYVNGVSFRADYNSPVLLLAAQGNDSYPYSPQWAVYNFGSNSSVRVVIYNYWAQAHPMHLHGHAFSVLAEGNGEWDGTITNPSNPTRRDTHIVPSATIDGAGYAVFEWIQDNPGIWPLHCHTAAHVGFGLYVNIMERPADIFNERNIPRIMAQTCRDWAEFTGTEVVDQIDSGV